ncbi:SufB/sufD domain protein [Leptospira ryugenii]|uniref:SufB/sufD domain protein n=1 Tax=Leptospira ryugenii TaxID=1917863 RepID=A0A2P2DWB1_9LEPT|nr:SufB/sufD domain protein [Leptospira ryugenii]
MNSVSEEKKSSLPGKDIQIQEDFQREAKASLDGLSFPSPQDEAWRKFPLHALELETYFQNANAFQTFFAEVEGIESPFPRLEVLNALKAACVANYFALHALSTARQFQWISFEGAKEVPDTKEILWNQTEGKHIVSVIIYYIPKNTNVKLHESFGSYLQSEDLHISNQVCFYYLEENASLEILTEEEYDSNHIQLKWIGSHQKRDSKLVIHSFPKKGFRGKIFYKPELAGKGAEFLLSGVSVRKKRELLDIDAKVVHSADYTSSKIKYKTIVADRAHHIFTGDLYIPGQVKKVTAHQESNNLSLHKKARAEANPKLEVMAEDVSCTHGATVGDLDEEQFFYLLTRGLSPEEAKALLLEAFYESSLSIIGFSELTKAELSARIKEAVFGS